MTTTTGQVITGSLPGASEETTVQNAGGVIMIPSGFNLVGTCGECGGMVLQANVWVNGVPPQAFCASCQRKTKPEPRYGPVREMEKG